MVLEGIESDLSKIIWLCGIIQIHSNSGGALRQVSIMSHSYQTYFDFLGLDLDFNSGFLIMRFTSVAIRARLQE
jgi:hypothetical protein